MKHFFTISLCFLALSLSAQETITYPYNPDGNADGLVAVPDLQDILAVYGNPFSPAEIMVGDTALSEWIQILYQALEDQQAVIEAMQGAGGCNLLFPDGFGNVETFGFVWSGTDNNYDSIYVVPEGRNLYLLHSSQYFIYFNNNNVATFANKSLPILFGEGDSLYHQGSSSHGIIGILVDKVYDVIHLHNNDSNYIVPEDKVFIVPGGGQYTYMNSPNFISSINVIEPNLPVIYTEGIELIYYSNTSGVLVDEDYFADCGGGGSSGESELDVFYATDFEVDEWNNFLPLQVNGNPDIVVYNYPQIGEGTLPILAPNPDNYNQFDEVKFMLGSVVPDNPPLPSIFTEVYYIRSDGEEDYFIIQADRIRSLIVGPDGFWRLSD